jgi:hypothetical protein
MNNAIKNMNKMNTNVDINIVASTQNGGEYNERGVQRIVPKSTLLTTSGIKA